MKRLQRAWLGGYEERVRFFLGLLVFVLAAANGANFLLLHSAWISLRDAVEEAVDAHGSVVAVRIGERLASVPGADPRSIPMSVLVQIAESSGCRDLALLDTSGRVLASTYGAPVGSRDDEFPSRLTLTPGVPGVPSFRPSIRIVDRGVVMIRYQAVRVMSPSGGALLVKSIHDTEDLASTGRRYRLLVWTQTIAIMVVLVASFAFGRWIARPYRMIASEAGAAALLEGGREPEDLVEAFRRVMEKMRAQDEELRQLHVEARAAAGGGGPEGFASGIARGMASGLIVLGPGGEFLEANPAAARILGWEHAPGRGSPPESWAGAGSPLARLIRDALRGEGTRSREEIEHAAITGAGARLHLGVSISPIQAGPSDPPGAAVGGFVCLVADLTEVRELEQRVRRREQLAALGTVSAGIAHEVRNALATILGYARLAEKGTGAAAQEHARAIVREVGEIGGAVEDFLRYARPARLHPSTVDVRRLLDELIEEVRHSGLLESMSVEIAGDGGSVVADAQALRQAFSNIIRNAAESSDRPVHLSIGISREPGHAAMTFSDDGDGIPSEHLDQIFVPFYTTRAKGTGMGLAIAQKTILDHEGSIEAAPRPGGGTIFKVVLPAGR
jgi:PAS domain S-box-containing protein